MRGTPKKTLKMFEKAMERPVVSLISGLLVLVVFVSIVANQQDNSWVLNLGATAVKREEGSSSTASATASIPNDKLFGGLISRGFDEQSCLSRYQTFLYRTPSPHLLSSYLVSKLRKYEDLHRKCGPHTSLFKKSIEQLKSNRGTDQLECNYVIWIPVSGLGNRMLTLASSFLYALLTNRVMLIGSPGDFNDLFCEPFLNSSWILPSDFPIKDLYQYDIDSEQSYGKMVEHKTISKNPEVMPTTFPSFVYLHLMATYVKRGLHNFFFCDIDQLVLRKINWLLIKSDNYFLPSLFMITQFQEELDRMFPSKTTAFHHLGRYLFHPSNPVWEMTTKYYNSYLAKAKQRVGIQIRIFHWATISVEERFIQIINCTRDENILPEINPYKSPKPSSENSSSSAVLITFLSNEYYEKMVRYFEKPAINGELVSIYQPSREEYQKSGQSSHDKKALSEIFLLSFSDVLVTSAASTFGYVSCSLAGIKPWFLLEELDGKVRNPPCIRAVSIEPCFHAPPNIDAKTRSFVDTRKTIRYIRPCLDLIDGVQLVD